MNTDSSKVMGDLFAELEQAWNDADGARYGAVFTDDADFVDIRGVHHSGSGAIAGGHQAIFDSIYKGSTVHYTVRAVTPIADGCLLALTNARLDAPIGPLAGVNRSTASAVAIDDGGTWKMRLFHNTLIQGQPDTA